MGDLEFSRMMTGLASDEILIPVLHTALYDPSFSGFDIHVRSWKSDLRHYDGRFHPSAHATLTLRQLYLYLVRPDLLVEERMPLTGVLAVTAGKFWHEFIQRVLLDQGILVRAEVPIDDAETNILGHADGVLSTGEGLEIKTINHYKVDKIKTEADLKEQKPGYWAQAQDYLMVTGWRAMRFLMINPDYPFAMSEFVVEPDHGYQARRRAVYSRALELARKYPTPELPVVDNGLPLCCGGPQSSEAKKCIGRRICIMGVAS